MTTDITGLYRARHLLDDLKEILEARKQEPEMPLLSLPKLSSKIWGLHRKRLYVVGARTGLGKSAFTAQLALDIALQGKKVVFLSLEATTHEILERLFCNQYKIDSFDLIRGRFCDYRDRWEKFIKKVHDLDFILSDNIGSTLKQINEVINHKIGKPDVLIIDYIQMIRGQGRSFNEDIAEFLKHLRLIAIREDIAVICVSQINREGEGELPTLAQLKGSGVIEEHADCVFLLHATKEDDGSVKKYYFYVAKNRNGMTGKVDMEFVGKHFLFQDSLVEVEPPDETKNTREMFNSKKVYKGHGYVED